jgi:hypothetical protein
VEGDRPTEAGPEQDHAGRLEVIQYSLEVRDTRREVALLEGPVGLATPTEVEPDAVVARGDGPLAPALVAAGLVALEAVTEDDQPVGGFRGRVVDGDDRLAVFDGNPVAGRHRTGVTYGCRSYLGTETHSQRYLGSSYPGLVRFHSRSHDRIDGVLNTSLFSMVGKGRRYYRVVNTPVKTDSTTVRGGGRSCTTSRLFFDTDTGLDVIFYRGCEIGL